MNTNHHKENPDMPANPKLKSQPYLVTWAWADHPEDAYLDEVEATTAKRAIAKLTRLLAAENAHPEDIRVFDVIRKNTVPGAR